MEAGEQQVEINRKGLSLSKGSYIYQITVENENGIFRQCKSLIAY
jgi:hypothetical protein